MTKREFIKLFINAYIDRYFALSLDDDNKYKDTELKYASGELKMLRTIYLKMYGEKSYKSIRRHTRHIAQKIADDV